MKNPGMGKSDTALHRLLSASLISSSFPEHLEPNEPKAGLGEQNIIHTGNKFAAERNETGMRSVKQEPSK